MSNYQQYIKEARRGDCLSEINNYSKYVFYMLNDGNDITLIETSVINACQFITDATGWTLDTQQKIIATAKSPSNVRIECDIPNGSPCRVLP